jgi:putative Mg2+ transporter-C (MgtC) family protein
MAWLTGNWFWLLPTPWCHVALALVATFCGAIVGGDRQRREKPAGLRTLILVSLGSAGFTMISFVFSSQSGDSGRVAAQIVTGVGFLGAGVMLHGRGTVSGTTTAATIWVMAATGMIAGVGYSGSALAMAVLVRLVLSVVGSLERSLDGAHNLKRVVLEFEPNAGITRVRLERILVEYNVAPGAMRWEKPAREGDTGRLDLELRLPHRHLRELLGDLVHVPEVRSIDEDAA